MLSQHSYNENLKESLSSGSSHSKVPNKRILIYECPETKVKQQIELLSSSDPDHTISIKYISNLLEDSNTLAFKDELFIGLAGALGTNLDEVTDRLSEIFETLDYNTEKIKLSGLPGEIIRGMNKKTSIQAVKELIELNNIPEKFEDIRLKKLMDIGDKFRKFTNLKEALAILAISDIRSRRDVIYSERPNTKTVYILKSLKLPEEIETLRYVYGSSFYLISVFNHKDKRIANLQTRIADTKNVSAEDVKEDAMKLIKRDESEEDDKFGQNLREAYPLADLFVDSESNGKLKEALERFVHLIFGDSHYSPTMDEFAMFNAHASAKKSGSLARQVGATISTNKGQIISVGMNELPKVGGGVYTTTNLKRRRYDSEFDPSDKRKNVMLTNLFSKLIEIGLISSKYDNEDKIEELVSTVKPKIKRTHVMNIIEYAREVHAEMDAITSASRSTVSTKKGILYTTTFPCHDCTKHIIAAGIKRVVYIEPYPKSLSTSLYSEFIIVDNSTPPKNKIHFESFVGVAPRKYIDLFTMGPRKEPSGKIIRWSTKKASLKEKKLPEYYLLDEMSEFEKIKKFLFLT